MPQYPRAPLIFPIKGLHEGVGYDFQPPGTTPDALNVRGFDPIRSRLRGGRRAGLAKYFADQINGSAVIQAMAKTVEGTPYISQDRDAGPTTIVDDDFSSYAHTIPTYLGENWVYKDQLAVGGSSGTGAQLAGVHWGVTSNGLLLDGAYTTATTDRRHLLLPLRFEGPNNVSVTMRANTKATTSNSSTGGVDNCQRMGPFIRGSADVSSFVMACLVRQAADDSVKLAIIYKSKASGETTLVSSAAITLSNSTTVLDTLNLTLSEDFATNTLTARIIWPGAGPAAADIDQTVTVVDVANNVSNRRVGFGVYGLADLTVAASSAFRTVKQITTSYFNDVVPALVSQISVSDAGSNRYYIPTNYTSVRIDTAGSGTFYSQAGLYDSNSDAANGVLRFDTTADTINSLIRNAASNYGGIFRNAALAPDGSRMNPEAGIRSGLSSGSGGLMFCTRFDSTFKNGIITSIACAEPTAAYATIGVSALLTISFDSFVANDLNANLGSISDERVPIHRNSTIRVVDDGALIRIYVDNVQLATQQSSALFPGETHVGVGTYDTTGGADPSILRVMGWRKAAASSTEDLPIGSTSSATLLIVAGGSVFGLEDDIVSTTINGDNAMTTERFQIQMQSGYNRTFMVDGTRSKVYNQQDNTVSNWVATAGAGTVPARSRLITLYRGRLVLAGVVDDPHNWFMSKLGDPFDWDYSPAVPSAIQAVAGNNSESGLVGDIITGLVPFSDDVLIFGGDHTIYAMTGDPAAGGSIDLITDQTGMAFGKAWAKDSDGTLYFWGQDGIYRMVQGRRPENFTKGRMDLRLREIDLNFNRIRMEWDYLRASLVVLIATGNIADACRVLVWESRSDAWWEDSYPASIGPNLFFSYDSANVDDQAFILGCRDGYLRQIDETANDDDGAAISSRVRFEPFIAPDHGSEVVLNSVLPILAQDSGPVMLNIYTGQSAEECVRAANPRVRRLLAHAGRNAALRQKVRGYAVQLELSQTGSTRWALEGLTSMFDQSGMPRAEVKSGS